MHLTVLQSNEDYLTNIATASLDPLSKNLQHIYYGEQLKNAFHVQV
jgi:hypothetical protein